MKKVQSTLFQSWGTNVSKDAASKTSNLTSVRTNVHSHTSSSKVSSDGFCDEDDAELDDETLLAACQEWDSSDSTTTNTHATPLEDLPGFDVSSGRIWIYPTNLPVRDYQLSIVEQSLLKNTLVTLPTGLGKTFIAAVVMYNFYRWYPSAKIVFMAPTKPLVAQQIEACYNIMAIPQNHTAEMTGSMHPPERKIMWQSRRVFFLTPQVLMNDLSRKACPADHIKCLVVDEAHKALGNHSYCQVVRELSKYTINFRVLALSATPGTDLKAVQQVLRNLMIAHIEIRSEEAIDIQKYVHSRTIDKYVVALGEELQAVQDKYLKIISLYVNKLNHAKCLLIKNPKSLTKYQVLMSRDAFRQDPPPHMQRAQQGIAEGDFAILISLYHGYELLLQHGMHSLHCFLKSMVDGSKGISRAKTELMRNHNFCSLMDELRMKFNNENEDTDCSNRSFSSSSVVKKRAFVYSHPKLKKLEEVVLEHFDKYKGGCTSDTKMSTRVMIFTQYRDSVHEITNMLNQHTPAIKCMSFIGQSSAGKSTKGFTQKEQLRVVREFRSGGYNTIVSTCVGEEGLDIGDVDLIVCYDAHKSPIRLVQRMGRTGRKRHGRIVMLVTEGKEELAYNQSLSNKKGIHKALHNNSKKLELYHNNQRLVPRGMNPVVHKMYLTVPTAYKTKADRKAASSSTNQSKINNLMRQGHKGMDNAYLNEEELKFWNLHYKLDDHQKNLVKKIPTGGRFLTIGDKASQKKQKNLSSEFSLSEWSIWQTKKQPIKFVDHSKRCKNFVEVEEFLEVQSFAEGEDVYGMEMATFLNKEDIVRRKSSKGIERFCVNQELSSKYGESGGKSYEDKMNDEVTSYSDCISNNETNKGESIETLKNVLKSNSEIFNKHKEDIEHHQKVAGKRKKKTKHLSPVQYSDDDDFQCNDLLPKEQSHDDPVTGNVLNKHYGNKVLNEGVPSIHDNNEQVFVPKLVYRESESIEEEDLKEVLQISDPPHEEHLDDHLLNEEQDSELSVIFPSTQVRSRKESLSFANVDKNSLPPEAPNISSLDFLDDIDDHEQSLQLSISTIDDQLQSLNKPSGKLKDFNKTSGDDTGMERMAGICKVSEGIDIVKVNPEKSIFGEKSMTLNDEKEISEIEVSDMDSDWDFEMSDVEKEAINHSIDKIDITNDIILKIDKPYVDTPPKMCVYSKELHEEACISSKTITKDCVKQKMTSSVQSQGFMPCFGLLNDNNKVKKIKAFYPQIETKMQKNKDIEIARTDGEPNAGSNDEEFDLQFDLNDFLNEEDTEDDDEIIPPSPAKFNVHSDRSQLSQMSRRGNLFSKSIHLKSQKIAASGIFIPSNSSTAALNKSHTQAFDVRSSSPAALQSSVHPTNLSHNNSLGNVLTDDTSQKLESNVVPNEKKQLKSVQMSILSNNKSNGIVYEENHEPKGLKRKSDPLPAWRSDGQKKRKLLTEDLKWTTDDDTFCGTLKDKSDPAMQAPKEEFVGTTNLEDDIAYDSEDEIQPKIRNKKNVLSSPIFKTPIKPAKKSKCIVVSSDSDDDKISSDELATPLQQRILKNASGISSTLLNHFTDDQEDFQDNYDVRKKLATSTKNNRIEIKSKKKRRKDKYSNELIDLEAEVDSDVECSSDEENASEVDHSILDFINDNTICSQGADLQSVYLQSIQDSDHHALGNRYRLAPCTHLDDHLIFSQVPQQDDDYGDDSFVVYEEDEHGKDNVNMHEMTINPENILETKTRRGQRQQSHRMTVNFEESKTKKLTRKRVIMCDSSSEEENIIKNDHVVNCREEETTASRVKIVDLHSSKLSNTETKDKQVHVQLKSCQSVPSTTVNLHKTKNINYELEIGKTQDQIAREERLRRQKEKQLEFRRKMSENERKSQATKTSVINLDCVSKKTDAKQTLKNSEINVVSIGNDCNDINVVERSQDKTIMSTNNESRSWLVSETATTSHVNTSSSNLREEYGLCQKSQRSGGEPVVVVSPGVLSSCPHIASTLQLQHNLNSIVHQLSACDFMISNRMGVIRKSYSDFANGANRNKLIDQVRYTCELFDRPCLIVETGRLKKPEEKTIINRSKYLDRTTSQLIRTHMKLLFTDSIDETASVLADLAHMESRKGFSIQIPDETTQKQDQIFKLCLSVPCLNFAGALCLSKNYSTFSDIISCSPSQLEVKARISASRAQQLHQFFRHRFNPEMLGNHDD